MDESALIGLLNLFFTISVFILGYWSLERKIKKHSLKQVDFIEKLSRAYKSFRDGANVEISSLLDGQFVKRWSQLSEEPRKTRTVKRWHLAATFLVGLPVVREILKEVMNKTAFVSLWKSFREGTREVIEAMHAVPELIDRHLPLKREIVMLGRELNRVVEAALFLVPGLRSILLPFRYSDLLGYQYDFLVLEGRVFSLSSETPRFRRAEMAARESMDIIRDFLCSYNREISRYKNRLATIAKYLREEVLVPLHTKMPFP